MFSGVPNLASSFGYTNASWTLKADLTCEYVCRLLNHMKATGTAIATPMLDDPTVTPERWIDFSSGYFERSLHEFPKQGSKLPWKLHQNYARDILLFRYRSVDDGTMVFAKAGAPGRHDAGRRWQRPPSGRRRHRQIHQERLRMKWKMSENSLFAILLRSPWWIEPRRRRRGRRSGVRPVAGGLQDLGATLCLPFLGIAAVAAWRQWQTPSAARVDRTLAAVKAMSRSDFVAAVEAAYVRDGYAVTRVDDAHADLALKQEWRTALVSCKRWKVARVGIEPLRELLAAKEARELREGIFIATGEITDTARKFAAENGLRLVGGARARADAAAGPAADQVRSA